MSNTFGDNVKITVFGESHGKAVGAVLDGIKPGMTVDEGFIKEQLLKRSPAYFGELATGRKEEDSFEILSGVYNGKTTGTPICFIIKNKDVESSDYESLRGIMRPSHADYTSYVKYSGFADSRGGGHFSGRLTAPLVAAGAAALKELNKRGIEIITHIKSCMDISDRDFEDKETDKKILSEERIAAFDPDFREKLSEKIKEATENGDSLGGILETVVYGLPTGVGEPWFDTFEGNIAKIIFSVPAVKGIEFGDGFMLSEKYGSEANDSFYYDENKNVRTKTNHNGGINGGISNGMPVVFRTVIKPTPSISKKQQTIDVVEEKNTEIEINGRHDPAVFLRAPVIINCAAALAILDLLSEGE